MARDLHSVTTGRLGVVDAELKSDGERLAAAYWDQRALPWEYEPEIGGRHPDFLVHHSRRDFVAEVFEPELRLPDGGGWFSSYPAIRSAFEGRKRKQIAATVASHERCKRLRTKAPLVMLRGSCLSLLGEVRGARLGPRAE